MSNQLATVSIEDETLERVLVGGDLSKLTPQQRMGYYKNVCQSIGLNPLTRPFDYITLNGKMVLYAKKDAADQLRKINNVSIDDVDISETGDSYVVKVKGHDNTGRSDVEIGVVKKTDMQGNAGNAQMKAVTKAKRRLTLSLCGLGWLDETEVETIPSAEQVTVTDEGEIIDNSPISLEEACEITNRDGIKYGDLPTAKLSEMANAINRSKKELTPEQLTKAEAIGMILKARNSGESKEPTPLVDAAAELGGVPA